MDLRHDKLTHEEDEAGPFVELYGVGLAELQHRSRVPGEEPALWVVQHFHAALSRDHVPFCVQQDQSWDACNQVNQSEKGRAGRVASLMSAALFSIQTLPLVFIIGSRKSRTREGRIPRILYRRGKKERERQPSTTSLLVVEKKTDKWGGILGGEGAGLPAFLRLQSVPRLLSSDYSAQAAVSVPPFF